MRFLFSRFGHVFSGCNSMKLFFGGGSHVGIFFWGDQCEFDMVKGVLKSWDHRI